MFSLWFVIKAVVVLSGTRRHKLMTGHVCMFNFNYDAYKLFIFIRLTNVKLATVT